MSDYINQADIPVKETIAHALGFDADGNWAKMVPADPADVRAAQATAADAKMAAEGAKVAANAASDTANSAKTTAEQIATTKVPGRIKSSETVVVASDGTATVPAATAAQAGVVKPGAGLTTEADGTTRIADDAHLPGTPTVDNNFELGQYKAPSEAVANQNFVDRYVFNTVRGGPPDAYQALFGSTFVIDNGLLNIVTTYYLQCPQAWTIHPIRIIFTRNKRADTIKFRLMPPGVTSAQGRMFEIPIEFEEIEGPKPLLITIYPDVYVSNGEVVPERSRAYYTVEELSAVNYYVQDTSASVSQREGPVDTEGEEAADA